MNIATISPMVKQFRRGHRHWATLEDQSVQFDSQTEEITLGRFIEKYGFHGQWIRPSAGLRHAGVMYRHDFELAVDDFGKTARAIVEVKQTRKDFRKETAQRMRTVAKHYNSDFLYLYASNPDKWYRISIHGPLEIQACDPPVPGTMPIESLYKPTRYIVSDIHGNKYYQSLSNGIAQHVRRALGFRAYPKKHRKRS